MENKLNKIIQADCLEYLRELPDGCVDLVVIDPPYNIAHAEWDKYGSQKEYINWLGGVFLECQRVLKENGSFYFWHNDFSQMAELQHWISQNTKFVFNSIISWVKPNFRPIGWKNLTTKNTLRSWYNNQEYCLFYTFEDDKIRSLHFKKYLTYMTEQAKLLNWQINDFNNFLGYKAIASHWFYNKDNIQLQPRFITKIDYEKLQTTGFFQKPYEELRAEYEELRYCFNIQNGQNHNNVWVSRIDSGSNISKFHTCEKPQDLLQKIILTSSKQNDIVLDCFMGSGSTAIASLETKRRFLGCERDAEYCKIANERLKNWKADLERQDKWFNERGVVDFESDIKNDINNPQPDLFNQN